MRAFTLLVTTVLLGLTTSLAEAQVQIQSTPPTWQTVLEANGTAANKKHKRQYAFECSYSKHAKKFLKLDNRKLVSSPKLILEEDQTGKLEEISQSPFVTGVQKVGTTGTGVDAYQPIITVLDEGYTIEVKITRLDEQHVQLDAQIEFKNIDSVQTIEVGERTTQSPIQSTISQRVVRSVTLGDKQKLIIPAFGKQKAKLFEFQITELTQNG